MIRRVLVAVAGLAVVTAAYLAFAQRIRVPHTHCEDWTLFPTGKSIVLICTRYAK